MKLIVVAGARPNFMKVAPLLWEIGRRPDVIAQLVHTGQHYDRAMSELFFEQLSIPRPDFNLGVGSGSHSVQTAEVMTRFEPLLRANRPDAVIVVGDVNSTLACALVAAKEGVPVAHVEAGLRSFDRTMPEEINRIVTDLISHWLFVSEPAGVENLRREGVANERIHLVGNVMIDTLLAMKPISDRSEILERLGLQPRQYAVLTLHRPANVDQPEILDGIGRAIQKIARDLPVIFPVHPRTRAALAGPLADVRPIDPLGYVDFLRLTAQARLVLTDSGGIQEETTMLGVPCLTLRENTERPITVTQGTNRLVGREPQAIIEATREVLSQPGTMARPTVEFWDGQAAQRIMDILAGSRT